MLAVSPAVEIAGWMVVFNTPEIFFNDKISMAEIYQREAGIGLIGIGIFLCISGIYKTVKWSKNENNLIIEKSGIFEKINLIIKPEKIALNFRF